MAPKKRPASLPPKPATRRGPKPSVGQTRLDGSLIELPDVQRPARSRKLKPLEPDQDLITMHFKAGARPVLSAPSGADNLAGSSAIHDEQGLSSAGSPAVQQSHEEDDSNSLYAASPVTRKRPHSNNFNHVASALHDVDDDHNDDDLYDASPIRPKRLRSLALAVPEAVHDDHNDDDLYDASPIRPKRLRSLALAVPEAAHDDQFFTPSTTPKAAHDDQFFTPSSTSKSTHDDPFFIPSSTPKSTHDDAFFTPLSTPKAALSGTSAPEGVPPVIEGAPNGTDTSYLDSLCYANAVIAVSSFDRVFRPLMSKMLDNAHQFAPVSVGRGSSRSPTIWTATNRLWAIQTDLDTISTAIKPWISERLNQLLSQPHITVQDLHAACKVLVNFNNGKRSQDVDGPCVYLVSARHTDGHSAWKVGWTGDVAFRSQRYLIDYYALTPNSDCSSMSSLSHLSGKKRDWTIQLLALAKPQTRDIDKQFGYFLESTFMLLLNTIRHHDNSSPCAREKALGEMARQAWIHDAVPPHPPTPGPSGPGVLAGGPLSSSVIAMLPLAQIDKLNTDISVHQGWYMGTARWIKSDGETECFNCHNNKIGLELASHVFLGQDVWRCRLCISHPGRLGVRDRYAAARQMVSESTEDSHTCVSCGVKGKWQDIRDKRNSKDVTDDGTQVILLTFGCHLICAREYKFFGVWGITTPRPPPANGRCENPLCRAQHRRNVELMYSPSLGFWHCYRTKVFEKSGTKHLPPGTDIRCVSEQDSIGFTSTPVRKLRIDHHLKDLDALLDELFRPVPPGSSLPGGLLGGLEDC
ncbi:MAG: hypothetical protein LQ349_007614 [Xanthoria aureola]|nr:MAG: hypothetical protein LQ349_007614 [Xanthoria aureola]